jgi:hypothetical protein
VSSSSVLHACVCCTDVDEAMNLTNPNRECGDTQTASVDGIDSYLGLTYGEAMRFPVLDIITFWPNRSNEKQSWSGNWAEDVHVEVLCLRPDQIAPGSRVPPSGEELLNKQGAVFTLASEGGGKPGSAVWMWVSVTVVGALIFL